METPTITAPVKAGNKVRDMTYIAVFAVLMAICSWISIPAMPPVIMVPFTMQTFAVFLAVGVLGGKRGTAAVLVYLLLGAVGVPVFANFSGGLGAILGTTGGYLVGFLFTALVMWIFERLLGRKYWVLAVSMVLGLAVCYAFGTVWFMMVYARNTAAIGVGTALLWCVVPFLLADGVKIALAVLLSNRLHGILKL